MISVRCANCEAVFEAEDIAAGQSEFCPHCGALNDVAPEDDSPGDSTQYPYPDPLLDPNPENRKFRGGFKIVVATFAVMAFCAGYWLLQAPDWESSHLQQLSDVAKNGDYALSQSDFAGARQQYKIILDTIGSRTLKSIYLQKLEQHATIGLDQANALAKAAEVRPRISATTTSAPTVISTAQAIREFQRRGESFAEIVGGQSTIIQDEKSQWRQRRWVIWDVSSQFQDQLQPPKTTLQFTCQQRVTDPHDRREDAQNDVEYAKPVQDQPFHCTAEFVLQNNQWIMDEESTDETPLDLPMRNELRGLVQKGFTAPVR